VAIDRELLSVESPIDRLRPSNEDTTWNQKRILLAPAPSSSGLDPCSIGLGPWCCKGPLAAVSIPRRFENPAMAIMNRYLCERIPDVQNGCLRRESTSETGRRRCMSLVRSAARCQSALATAGSPSRRFPGWKHRGFTRPCSGCGFETGDESLVVTATKELVTQSSPSTPCPCHLTLARLEGPSSSSSSPINPDDGASLESAGTRERQPSGPNSGLLPHLPLWSDSFVCARLPLAQSAFSALFWARPKLALHSARQ
jgi:hypothetical protein